MDKTVVNLVDLKKLLEKRDWDDLTEDEKSEFCEKLAKQISGNSSDK